MNCYSKVTPFMTTVEAGVGNFKDRCNCLRPCNYLIYDSTLENNFMGYHLIKKGVSLISSLKYDYFL